MLFRFVHPSVCQAFGYQKLGGNHLLLKNQGALEHYKFIFLNIMEKYRLTWKYICNILLIKRVYRSHINMIILKCICVSYIYIIHIY